jgi:hypothetical protein
MDYKADAHAKEINPTQPTHQAAKHDSIIEVGTKEKRRILNVYEEKFRSGYTDSIVTTKKGKHVNTTSDLPKYSHETIQGQVLLSRYPGAPLRHRNPSQGIPTRTYYARPS